MPAPKTLRYADQLYVADHFADGTRGKLDCTGTTLTTNGKGLWSRVAKSIKCLSLQLGAAMPSSKGTGLFAELRVYFDPKSWNVKKDGLIYTDKQWLQELRDYLIKKLKFSPAAARAVDYSEQGMQGDNYVSLDAQPTFVAEWDAHTPKQPKKQLEF